MSGGDPGVDSDRADPAIDVASPRGRTKKSPSAFRTISEVADDLHIPQHVLRFWETRFPQVHPLKRGGGRRYYRPEDIALLRRISDLLYVQGYTIKGVQRLLREGGGMLADDIPPAAPDERAEAEREQGGVTAAEPELPIPGLRAAQPGSAAPAARGAARPRTETEVERLRRILAETLVELEALRALLP
jgi:DNA-binding transcriptional MerR regulator